MNARYPLREKRKRQTRMALIDAALDLFSARGYDDTTLEQIADHAGLHVQTLYRHFSSKPHLATAADQDRLDEFSAAIESVERSTTTFEFWREWIQLSVHRLSEQTDGLDRYRQLIRRTVELPTISTRMLTMGYEYERLLTESLGADFLLNPTENRLPRLVACMLWGANAEVARRFAHDGDFDFIEEAVSAADDVEDLFGEYVKR